MKLKRELGLLELTVYGVGVILGAGIYVIIGKAAGLAGDAVWLSFLLGSFVASLTGLSYSELSSIFPKSAAEYVYVRKAFGKELLAFLTGWLIIITEFVSAAAVSLGFSSYLTDMLSSSVELPCYANILIAIFLILFLSFVNFWGIKESSRLNILFTLIETIGLLIVIFLGFKPEVSVSSPKGLEGIIGAAALMFFAYLGFEEVVNLAEETKKPRKNIPRALVLSIIITTLLYVLVSISAVNLASWKELAESDAPLALAVSKKLGKSSYFLLSFIALFSTSNTVLTLLIVSSRMMYGMASSGSLPRFLSSVHKKRRTPWISILISMFVSISFVVSGSIEVVAGLTSFSAFLTFALVNACVIVLRYKKPNVRRGFRVPVNIGRFPLLSFVGFLTCIFMSLSFDLPILVFGVFLLFSGIVFYYFLKRKV